jgi:DNA-binding phage protein
MTVDTTIWDVVQSMKTKATERACLEAALEERDPALVALAFCDANRARGLHEFAEACNGTMSVATLLAIADGLGYHLSVTPKKTKGPSSWRRWAAVT